MAKINSNTKGTISFHRQKKITKWQCRSANPKCLPKVAQQYRMRNPQLIAAVNESEIELKYWPKYSLKITLWQRTILVKTVDKCFE